MTAQSTDQAGTPAERRRLAGMDTKLCFAEYGENIVRPYRLFVPSNYQYAPSEPGGEVEQFPLVVMLHGGGSGSYPCDENWFFANKETPERVQTFAEERGYLIACPPLPFMPRPPDIENRAENWRRLVVQRDVVFIKAVIQDLVYNMHVDESRIYLAGASRGGFALYATLDDEPERFAAAVPICSAPDPETLDHLAKVPLLILHAVEDQFFPIGEIRELEKDLAGRGCDVRLEEFPGVHDGLRNAKAFTLMFDWFDSHRREKDREGE